MTDMTDIALTVVAVLVVCSAFAMMVRVSRADRAVRRENARRHRQWESDCADAQALGVLPPVPPNRIGLG